MEDDYLGACFQGETLVGYGPHRPLLLKEMDKLII